MGKRKRRTERKRQRKSETETERAREGEAQQIPPARGQNADRRRGDHAERAQETLREAGDSHRGRDREQATGYRTQTHRDTDEAGTSPVGLGCAGR